MDAAQAKKLREPFKPNQIGKLPKPTKRDNPKGRCNECGGYHGLPAVHLDYVGHAAITDRLLEVDPAWTWEPMATDGNGFPLLDQRGGLWIRLTICGVTRPGYGDETNGRGMKEIIGDALRNGAMRFGVGLDLWSKEDLHGDEDEAKPAVKAVAKPVPHDEFAELSTRLLGVADQLGVRELTADAISRHPGDVEWLKRQIVTATKNLEAKKAA